MRTYSSPWIIYLWFKVFSSKSWTCLPIHCFHLNNLLVCFKTLVRNREAACFSNLVSKTKGSPRVLFDTVILLLLLHLLSQIFQKSIMKMFILSLQKKKQKTNVRNNNNSASSLSVPAPAEPVILGRFLPASFLYLLKLIELLTSSSCSLHILPATQKCFIY